MLDKNYVKPIPKSIIAIIKREDKIRYKTPCGNTRFYSYLAVWKKELVKITVAVKHYKEQWFCKQVAVHGLRSTNALVKDIEFYYVGGYVVGWHDIKASSRKKNWEDGIWYSCDGKYYDMYAPTVNLDFLVRFPEYQYSEYKRFPGDEILKYLRLYEQFPECEYLIKSGLSNYAMNKTILKQVKKDKAFHKWLMANYDKKMEYGRYYCDALLEAYKKKLPLQEVQAFAERKKGLITDYYYKTIKSVISPTEFKRFFHYLDKENASYSLYSDYIHACRYLNIDLTLDRNRFPRDFRFWHDLRVEEMYTRRKIEQEKADKERQRLMRIEQRKIARGFAKFVKKYSSLTHCSTNANFAVLIAKNPADLEDEGKALHHCVGSGTYDKKMSRGETIIFFVRRINEMETPFVTFEYSPSSKKILQCYAKNNSKPEDNVMQFVENEWLPNANKKVQKIAA